MDAGRFLDEFRPFRRGELALARRQAMDALPLPAAEQGLLRYALRLAQLSTLGPERDDLVERLAPFRLRLLQLLAPVLPTEPRELDARALHAALPEVVGLVGGARSAILEAGLASGESLDAQLATKRLALVLGGAGGCGYVYLGVLERLAELGIAPGYLVGCSIGAIVAVLRARSRAFDLAEVLEEIRLLRRAAALGPPGRSRFGLPGALRLDLHRALAPLFADEAGAPRSLGGLEIPVDTLAAGLGAGASRLPASQYAELVDPEHRSAASLAGLPPGRLARVVAALVSLAMSRRLLVPILLGADAETAALPALDAAGFSSAIPGLLQYDLAPGDAQGAAALEALFAAQGLVALVDGLLVSAVPARRAWEALEAGRIGSRNYAIVALHALEARQRGAHALLSPLQRVLSATAHAEKPFCDLQISFRRAPALLDLLPAEAALRRAVASGREEFGEFAPVLAALLAPVPAWKELTSH